MKQAEQLGAGLFSAAVVALFVTMAIGTGALERVESKSGDTKIKVIKIPRLNAGGEVQAQTPAVTDQEAEPAQPSRFSFPPRIKKIITHREGKEPEERTLPDLGRTNPPEKRPLLQFDEAGGKLDMVLVRGRPPLQGWVVGLTGGLLQFSDQDQQTVPLKRRDLVMLTFTIGQIGVLPQLPDDPEDVDPEDDLVITYDGKSVSAKVSAITEESVITNKTTFPRSQVHRILFGEERPGGSVRAEEKDKKKKETNGDSGGPTEPSGGDRTGEGLSADPSRPAETLVKACPKGEPLGGWLVARFKNRHPETVTSQVRLRVHFLLVYRSSVQGRSATWNEALRTGFEAPRMYYNLRMTNTAQTPGTKWDSCTISDDQISGTTDLSVHWDTATYGNSGSVSFDPLKPELNIFFPDEVRVNQPYECRESDPRGGSASLGGHGISFHRLNIDPPRPDLGALLPGNYGDAFSGNWVRGGGRISFGLSVPGTKCHRAQGPLGQECVTHPDRYAAIPLVGDFTAMGEASETVQSAPVRFGICCGCGKIPDEQEFADEEENDCLDSAGRQLGYSNAEFNRYYKALETGDANFGTYVSATLDYQRDWKAAMTVCGLNDITFSVIRGFDALSRRFSFGPGGPVSWSMRHGRIYGLPPSPGWQAPTGLPQGGIGPAALLNWKALEYLVDGFNLFKQGPQSDLLRDKLARCDADQSYSPSALVLPALMLEWEVMHRGAKKFLDYRDRAERQAKENTSLMSDLIQLDIERFSQMANLHARCQDCSEEQGTDPKHCDFLKRDLEFASE